MTIIAEKLKAAGVKIPSLQERVWRIVRDNPGGITANRVSDILDPTNGNNSVSTLLSQMEQRKMVTSRQEKRRTNGPHGAYDRNVKVYTTTLREYEVLPVPRKETAATRAVDVTKAVVAQVKAGAPPVTTVIPQPPTVNNAASFVEMLTIAEARALWAELNKMFGAKQ